MSSSSTGSAGTSAEQRFAELAESLAPAGVDLVTMFGAKTLLHNGKVLACLAGDTAGFKLGRDTSARDAALALPGSTVFDPARRNRALKDWVGLPIEQSEHWLDLAEQALAART